MVQDNPLGNARKEEEKKHEGQDTKGYCDNGKTCSNSDLQLTRVQTFVATPSGGIPKSIFWPTKQFLSFASQKQ